MLGFEPNGIRVVNLYVEATKKRRRKNYYEKRKFSLKTRSYFQQVKLRIVRFNLYKSSTISVAKIIVL